MGKDVVWNTFFEDNSRFADVISKYAKLKEDMVDIEDYRGAKGGIDMCKGIRDLMADSRAEGREAGIEQMQIQVIRNMLRKGITVEDICELAECSVEEVERVREGKIEG